MSSGALDLQICPNQYCTVDLCKSRKRIRKQKPESRSISRNGDSNLIEITDSLLRSIRLKCTNLDSISFDSCKIDYYSRPFQGNLPSSLYQVTLKNVAIYNSPVIPLNTSSLFFKLQKFLPNLKEITITEPRSGWYTNADRNCLANNKNLRTLENLPESAAYCKQLKFLQFNQIRS